MKSVCVFCGSSAGNRDSYKTAARKLGRLLAEKEITLIYGGSNVGLMAIIADEVLALGGKVIGVMPDSLIEKEVAHPGLTEFIRSDSMSERKEVMMNMADGFIAMPGGVGTLDELFEVMSWNQLGLMSKPLALLNTDHYWDHLVDVSRSYRRGKICPDRTSLQRDCRRRRTQPCSMPWKTTTPPSSTR